MTMCQRRQALERRVGRRSRTQLNRYGLGNSRRQAPGPDGVLADEEPVSAHQRVERQQLAPASRR
jgi:hypothetical protein